MTLQKKSPQKIICSVAPYRHKWWYYKVNGKWFRRCENCKRTQKPEWYDTKEIKH